MLRSETGVSKVKQQKIKELTWSAREASDVCARKKQGAGTGTACRAQGHQRSMLRCRRGRGMRLGEGDNEHATRRGVDAKEGRSQRGNGNGTEEGEKRQ